MSKKKKRKNKHASSSKKNTRKEVNNHKSHNDNKLNNNNNTKSNNNNKPNNTTDNKPNNTTDNKPNHIINLNLINSNPNEEETKMTTNSNNKIKKAIIIGSLTILVLGSGAILNYNTAQMSNKSYSGIYLDNQSVSNLNETELKNTINHILSEKIINNTLNIKVKDDIISANLEDLGVSYNIDGITSDILNLYKSGNVFTDTFKRLSLLINNYDYIAKPIIDEDILLAYINDITDKYSIEAQNAIVTIKDGKLNTQPEKYGKVVDSEKLKKDIIKAINQDISDSNIKVSFVTTKPVLTEDVAKNMQILSTYKTSVNSNRDRTSNIRLFLSKFNMTVLAPNEEFSCNKRAGSRERSDGYKAAPGYINGQVIPIVAGGICQGTTTLYNALVYADLEILERHPHSMPVTYASNGRDAAIAGDYKDLRFKNNTKNPIILNTYVTSDGYVVATIWGIKENKNKKIEIAVNHINSKAADAYKQIYIDGKLIRTELLSRDRYK